MDITVSTDIHLMPMKINRIVDALEALAPLGLQETYDNAGLQVGLTSGEVSGVLLCLDITEGIVDEAIALGCNLIVSHHPLIFKPLNRVSDSTWQQRCVLKAIKHDITIYSAHTNLDNAPGGVNHRIASLLGLQDTDWLEPGADGGSGLTGTLGQPEDAASFIARVKSAFGVECVMHNGLTDRQISKVAVCGGAGSFLMEAASAKGADCFITGEMSYHHFFDAQDILVMAIGHYQSEQYTKDLLRDYLSGLFPDLRIEMTRINTNPIKYS